MTSHLRSARQRHHRASSENDARQTSGRLSTALAIAFMISGIRPSRRSGWP